MTGVKKMTMKEILKNLSEKYHFKTGCYCPICQQWEELCLRIAALERARMASEALETHLLSTVEMGQLCKELDIPDDIWFEFKDSIQEA